MVSPVSLSHGQPVNVSIPLVQISIITCCVTRVHPLIQHIKPFKVLLVKYDSLHLTPSLTESAFSLSLSLSPFGWLSRSLCDHRALPSHPRPQLSPIRIESPSSSAGKCLSGVCFCVYVKFIHYHL